LEDDEEDLDEEIEGEEEFEDTPNPGMSMNHKSILELAREDSGAIDGVDLSRLTARQRSQLKT